jgi:alpha-tubulin suppressor-like RCC1 family protein
MSHEKHLHLKSKHCSVLYGDLLCNLPNCDCDCQSSPKRKAANHVYASGQNRNGELGNGTNIDTLSAVPIYQSGILSGKRIVKIAADSFHVLALTSQGKVYAWGRNSNGQLGNGNNINSNIPIAVDTSGVLSNKFIVDIAVGSIFSLAIDRSGKAYSWGRNTHGQLGDNTNIDRNVPVAVDTSGVLSGKRIIKIAGGSDFSLALDSTGVLYSWGAGNAGQLGNGGIAPSWSPVNVDMSGVLLGLTMVDIACGVLHALAVSSSGLVYSWGFNSNGQCGVAAPPSILTPVAVDVSGVLAGKFIISASAGGLFSIVLDSNGAVYGFGSNSFGQLGISSASPGGYNPQAVDTSGVLAGKIIKTISSGISYSLALDSNGNVYCWGNNTQGQFGSGAAIGIYLSPLRAYENSRQYSIISSGAAFSLAATK